MLLRRCLLTRAPLRCSRRAESSASASLPGGRPELTLRTGHVARFADGAVVAESGDSAVLATVVSKARQSQTPSDGISLVVDFKQSAAAMGRIPTTYLRREMSQSDSDILSSRIIDRTVRPLFYNLYNYDTQVLCKPLALDDSGDAVVLGLNAASAALAVSHVPLQADVAAVRVGIINGDIVLNPTPQELKSSSMNLLLSGTTENRVLVIEMDGREIQTEVFVAAVEKGFAGIDALISAISNLRATTGKPKIVVEDPFSAARAKVTQAIKDLVDQQLTYILMDPVHDKTSRDVAIAELRKTVAAAFADSADIPSALVYSAYADHVKGTLRRLALELEQRCDGRKLDEFRPIDIKVDVYKKLHGSAVFQRGQSQVFGTVTFDSPDAAFHPDSIAQMLGAQQKKMFMLHYEFPSFATGDLSGSSRSYNRRELGHGTLAEKALKHVVPDDFPYCIRLACQVLESNGSTSMASACVGSLALFDAGVPLKAAVGGVAIGMVSDDTTGQYAILTDLLGIEDYAGDMDFKMAGSSRGFTSMQMDVKTLGLNPKQLQEALQAGRAGLNHVLSKMSSAIDKPRSEFKSTVPVMSSFPLPSYKRSVLFRAGGLNVKAIAAETGVRIFVEDDSNIGLLSPSPEAEEQAKAMINQLLEENSSIDLDFGAIYKVEIVEIKENGIFVRIKAGTRPIFIANHNLDARKVSHASALGLEVGQLISVQYLGRDSANGNHRFSRKLLQTTAPRGRSMPSPVAKEERQK